MTHKNFLLLKEIDCKVQLRFVKFCTLVFTGLGEWGGGGVGRSEPLRRGFRKFLGSKEYLEWLNDTGKTLFYSIQY